MIDIIMIVTVTPIGKAPFKCPVCRAVFEIPGTAAVAVIGKKKHKGKVTTLTASSLPVNHFASTVLTAASSSSSSFTVSVGKRFADPNHVVCEGCEENEATEYCKECSMAFCATCKKIHLKPKMSAHHQFISLDEAMKPESGGESVLRITRCEKHPHQEINTYCHADKQAICAECAIDHHKGHEIDRLSSVVQGFKQGISLLVDKVWTFLFFFFDTF